MKHVGPLLIHKQPKCSILEQTLSTSGRYLCFFGVHYEAGVTCWVVGVSDKTTGEIVQRHYNEKIEGCISPKAQASTYWEEFKHMMTERREHGTSEEDERTIEKDWWLETARAPYRPN